MLITLDSDISLSAAAECLVSSPSLRDVRVELDAQNRLHLMFEGWRLIMALEEYPWVEEESREMAEDHPDQAKANEVVRCGRRLAIWSEDPDPNMNHFNDWLLSVECLQRRFLGLLVFDPVNGEWW